MNELLNQFEKETGNRTEDCGPKIYRDKYVQWLEAKVVEWLENKVAQKPEVSEEDLKWIKEIRNYFGENDTTQFEHSAYFFLDNLFKKLQ